ncbi:glycosyltransferase family 2 protein [Candidatus Omnitrophota bacterium]
MKVWSNKIVSVIIVTCGVGDYLISCLDSLRRQTHKALQVILIDNSLNPQFRDGIIRQYPQVQLYSEGVNIFFTGALNKGISESQGDFILCLNDDVILDSRFIQEALCGFYQDSSIGMVSGKILRSDGMRIDSAGLFLTPWRTARERGYGRQDKGQYNRAGYVFGVSGAVALYRRSMLESIKIAQEYFDADFRMFYEDLDLAWRAQNLGWKAYYVPQAVAYHIRGATARKSQGVGKSGARRYLNDELHLDLIKNRHLSIIKNESLLGFLLHLPFILFYDLLATGYILFFRFPLLKKPSLNSRLLKQALRKRRIIQKIK